MSTYAAKSLSETVNYQLNESKKRRMMESTKKGNALKMVTGKKTGFYDLAREIRDVVYRYAFIGSQGKIRSISHAGGATASSPRLNWSVGSASFRGLLLCTKQVHAEARPILLEEAQLEITEALDQAGKLKPEYADLRLARYIKVRHETIYLPDFKVLLKSLSNLQSLTYRGPFEFDFTDNFVDALDNEIDFVHQLENYGAWDGIDLTGRGYDREANDDCINELLIFWDWSLRPFQLLVESEIFCARESAGVSQGVIHSWLMLTSYHKQLAILDVNAAELSIYNDKRPRQYLGTIRVSDICCG